MIIQKFYGGFPAFSRILDTFRDSLRTMPNPGQSPQPYTD